MRVDRTALNREELPFIDLHQERRAMQGRLAALNARRLMALALLVLLQCGVLLPLTLQALAFRPRIALAQRRLADSDRSLQTAQQANNHVEPILQHWNRYQQSRAARENITQIFYALARQTPSEVYIEQVQIEAPDRQPQLHLQGVAQNLPALGDFISAAARTPEFSTLRLTETTFANIAGRREVHFRAEATP